MNVDMRLPIKLLVLLAVLLLGALADIAGNETQYGNETQNGNETQHSNEIQNGNNFGLSKLTRGFKDGLSKGAFSDVYETSDEQGKTLTYICYS